MRLRPRSLLGLLLCTGVVVSTASLRAQSFTGSVSGTVQDESGGTLAQATVTLVNESTNQRRSQATADSGTFTFPAVLPGTYRLEVEAAGFKRYLRSRITVEVQ